MKKFKFEIDYAAFYRSMLPTLIPVGLLYLILSIVPITHFFTLLLDTVINVVTIIAIPREHMSAILTIFLGIFMFCTLTFLVFGVPLFITSAFRLVCCKTTVTRHGIEAAKGPSFNNDYYTLKWDDMEETKIVRFLGLPYMVISSEQTPPLWIPMFYDQQHLMPEVFAALAPKKNVIRQHFEPQKKSQ